MAAGSRHPRPLCVPGGWEAAGERPRQVGGVASPTRSCVGERQRPLQSEFGYSLLSKREGREEERKPGAEGGREGRGGKRRS